MRLLSYPLSPETPMYGGGPGPEILQTRSIDSGDSSNSLSIHISNHTGTHIDCPAHFDSAGKKITDYPPDYWYSSTTACITIDYIPTEGELINPESLHRPVSISGSERAVLLRTGWCDRRSEPRYREKPPGLGIGLADWIRENFPSACFFGFDLISASSFLHRETGREVHREFLKHERPILLIEDMDLRTIGRLPPGDLLLSPLFISGADAAPVTVWTDIH